LANAQKHTVRIPVVINEETAAVALHEIGHCTAGYCARCQQILAAGRQRPNQGSCLDCENLAWQAAERLAPAGFSKQMHAARRRYLGSYIRSLASRTAPSATDKLAAEMTTTLYFHGQRLARERFRDLEQRVASWKLATHTRKEEQPMNEKEFADDRERPHVRAFVRELDEARKLLDEAWIDCSHEGCQRRATTLAGSPTTGVLGLCDVHALFEKENALNRHIERKREEFAAMTRR